MVNRIENLEPQPPSRSLGAVSPPLGAPLPILARYGLAALLVAGSTAVAFVVDHLVTAPNLTLVFVLPVIVAASNFGWGPSLATILLSVASFDFFFTRPYFTLQMTEPAEIWAAALLLITAMIVSAVAGQARRRALDAHRAAEQAQALQGLAHVIVAGAPRKAILDAAATALSQIFRAPAVVYAAGDGFLRAEAKAGGAVVSEVENEAAMAALEARTHLQAEAYPNDQSRFDLWPVTPPAVEPFVLGVDFRTSGADRPGEPGRFIEIVGAYLAASLKSDQDGPTHTR